MKNNGISILNNYIDSHTTSFNEELLSNWQLSPSINCLVELKEINSSNKLKTTIKKLKVENTFYRKEIEKLTNEIIDLRNQVNQMKTFNVNSKSADSVYESETKIKILVLGAIHIKTKDILGIAKKYGLTKENIELHVDYIRNKRFDVEAIKWGSRFSGILVGPVAHKVIGMGANSSICELLNEEGYPPFSKIKTYAGNLKISKTALSNAFQEIMAKIDSRA